MIRVQHVPREILFTIQHNFDDLHVSLLKICPGCFDMSLQFQKFLQCCKKNLEDISLERENLKEDKLLSITPTQNNQIEILRVDGALENTILVAPIENSITITQVSQGNENNILLECLKYDPYKTKLEGGENNFQEEPIDLSLSSCHDKVNSMDSILSMDEKRKAKNREASRRYRQKIRKDPQLLLVLREQQKKRQKRYYEKLRNTHKHQK